MDKKKILAIIVFIFFGFFMFAFANPKEDNLEKVSNNNVETTTKPVVTNPINNNNNNNSLLAVSNDNNTNSNNLVNNTDNNNTNNDNTGNNVVQFIDSEKPVITLNGKDVIIRKNNTYTELGATVTDNYDNDIASKLVINNNIDNTKKGEYQVTYNVTDESGNKADEKVRNVTVTDADLLVDAITNGNDLINNTPTTNDTDVNKKIDELKDLINDAEKIVKDEESTQKEIDDITNKINDLINDIKSLEFTVKYVDFDKKVLKEEKVKFMGSVTAPVNPTRTGYTFTGFDGTSDVVVSDLVINAIYKINSYKLTFMLNDNVYKVYDKVEYNTELKNLIPSISYEDYEDFVNYDNVASNMPANDVTYYAYKKLKKYEVKFVDYDNTLIYKENVTYGESANAPVNPTRIGYKFTGWDKAYDKITGPVTIKATYEILNNIPYVINIYKDNQLAETINDRVGTYNTTVSYQPATITGYTLDRNKSVLSGKIDGVSTLTLSAYYTSNNYTLKIYTETKNNRGRVVENIIYTRTYKYNETIDASNIDLKAPTGKKANLSAQIPATMPEHNVNIKVTYEKIKYNFKYNLASDETIGNHRTERTFTIDDEIRLYDASKPGFDFVEYRDQDGNKITKVSKNTAHDVTVTPVFKEKNKVPYTKEVKVEKLDGTFDVTTETLYGTTNRTATLEKTEKTGYYIDEVNSVLSGTIKGNGSLKLTIIYKLNSYSLTYKVNGNVVKHYDAVKYGADITDPKVDIDESEVFSGFNSAKKMPAANTIYEGTITKKTFNVVFKSEGTTVSTQTVTYGESAIAPTSPVKTDYTFAGWDKAFNNVKSNLTINATFTPNIVKLKVTEKPNAHFEYTKGKTYNIKDEIESVEFVYADNSTKTVNSYDTDFSTSKVGAHTLTITATNNGKSYTNKDITYKVIEEVTFQTKFEVKFTDKYDNKCSIFSSDCNYLTIVEHYDELIDVQSVSVTYKDVNGKVKLELSDMVNYSSYGYDSSYGRYVYRDPEYLAAHNINIFDKLTGKVMDNIVIDQVFVTYKMMNKGSDHYGKEKTITFNYNAANNKFTAISER